MCLSKHAGYKLSKQKFVKAVVLNSVCLELSLKSVVFNLILDICLVLCLICLAKALNAYLFFLSFCFFSSVLSLCLCSTA